MPSIGGVTCTEVKGSPTLNATNDGATGGRVFDCEWGDRFTLLRALLGTYTIVGGVIVGYTYPATFPGFSSIVALSASIKGIGEQEDDGANGAAYPLARLQVGYGPLEWDDTAEEDERVLSTEQYDFSGEFMEQAAFSYEWDGGTDNGTAIPQKIGMLVPTIDHTITRYNLNVLPKDEISARLGTVNDDEFLGVAADHLLFIGASAQRSVTTSGTKPYELTMVFKERLEDWNTIFNQTDRVYQKVAPVIYGVADLTPLLDSRPEETT